MEDVEEELGKPCSMKIAKSAMQVAPRRDLMDARASMTAATTTNTKTATTTMNATTTGTYGFFLAREIIDLENNNNSLTRTPMPVGGLESSLKQSKKRTAGFFRHGEVIDLENNRTSLITKREIPEKVWAKKGLPV